MKKALRKHIKQEKIIAKLLWKKGFIKELDLADLCWGYGYEFDDDIPCLGYWENVCWDTDECDFKGIYEGITDMLWWDNSNAALDIDIENTTSTFKVKSRYEFILWLRKKINVRTREKINKKLKINWQSLN